MTKFTAIPFDKIVKFGQATLLDSDLFTVSWILGRFCNYSCSYCWPYANSQTPDHLEYDLYSRTIDEIRYQASNNGFTKFHWSFSGGEPTAYKHLLDLLAKIHYDSLHMTTNLSPGLQYWEKYLKVTELSRRRSITASFHHEFANEDEFINKCLFLIENNVFVTINQVMVPNQFYQLYERCKKFFNSGINVTLKPQTDESASYVVQGYTGEMIEIMKQNFIQHHNNEELSQVKLYDSDNHVYYIDQAERFNAFDFNKFSGWNCNAGYQGIVIRENEVKRSYSCHDEILGTVTEGFKIFDKPKICITPTCMSSADSKLPKFKNV